MTESPTLIARRHEAGAYLDRRLNIVSTNKNTHSARRLLMLPRTALLAFGGPIMRTIETQRRTRARGFEGVILTRHRRSAAWFVDDDDFGTPKASEQHPAIAGMSNNDTSLSVTNEPPTALPESQEVEQRYKPTANFSIDERAARMQVAERAIVTRGRNASRSMRAACIAETAAESKNDPIASSHVQFGTCCLRRTTGMSCT